MESQFPFSFAILFHSQTIASPSSISMSMSMSIKPPSASRVSDSIAIEVDGSFPPLSAASSAAFTFSIGFVMAGVLGVAVAEEGAVTPDPVVAMCRR